MSFIKYIVLSLIVSFIDYGDGCTFPSPLRDGTWYTNDMGDVTFNSTHFTVASLANFGSLTFQCITKTNNRYYLESAVFEFLGSNLLKASMCFELTKMTDYKYSYYLLSDVLENTDVNRIILEADTYSFTSAETCSLTTTLPTQARLFIRSGFENQTASNCSNPISRVYTEYNITSNSSFTCNETLLNVCDDRTQLVFNYTMCADIMAYSAGGQLYCMWDYEDGNTLYTLLYNQDASPDESTYYRFTCMVSQTVGDNVTYISTYPRACQASQTAYNSTSASKGLTAVMYANSSCADVATTSESAAQTASTEVLSAGGAAAIAIGLIILLVAVVVIGLWYYFKVHKKKKIQPDSEQLVEGKEGAKTDAQADDKDGIIPAKSPPIDTNINNDEKSGRVSPFSPYPTVSELACYRFGPEPATVEIDDDDGGMTLEATTPGFTEGRRTKYEMKDNESIASLPVYSEVGDPTPDPTRLSEVQTRLSEFTVTDNVQEPIPFTMTRATMNIPEENTVSPITSPRDPA